MSKGRSATLRRDISRLAATIHQKNSKLDDAGKKDLSFIHKHLRKAAKAIERNVGKAKPPRKAEKKSPAPRTRKPRPPQQTPAKAQPPVKAQGPV
ncbi:MAG TPA: hypothetical protein VF514_16240 [Bacteroidota bacterium]